MMAMSNFCGTGTLKFNDAVGVLLSEEARMKSSGSAETSGSSHECQSERKVGE